MVAWAAIIPAIGAAVKAAAPAIATGLKAAGGAVATGTKKVGSGLATGKDKLVEALNNSNTIFKKATEPQPNPIPSPSPEPVPDGTTKIPEETEAEARRRAFIKALSSSGEQLAKQQSANNYEFTPSAVDYSQYMGLNPITQRYLYGGM